MKYLKSFNESIDDEVCKYLNADDYTYWREKIVGIPHYKAINIIKKFFINSELAKENKIYQTISKTNNINEGKAEAIISTLLELNKTLDKNKLAKEKFNLIKEIKANYVLEDFFKTKVNNYKTLAAIYKLFEFTVADSPVEAVNNRYTLIEHITRKEVKKQAELNEMSAQPERRTEAFHGTLNDIKATPKLDKSKPDSRLEDLSRKTFF